jgi:hypothetical protein
MLLLFSFKYFKYFTTKYVHISILHNIKYFNLNSSENHIDKISIPKNKL